MLRIHKRNLEKLEERKAKLAGEVNLGIENQIEEERANIAALEPIANPPVKPSPKVAEFVKATTPGEIDLLMLYIQGVQVNQRLTTTEEQLRHVVEEQSRAAVWRMQMGEDVGALTATVTASEKARKVGAKWYRRALIIGLALSILALLVACAALAAARL